MVSNPPTRLPFPYNQRILMAGWNLLFLRAGAYQNDPAKDSQWNRGAYLAEGLGHCSACHTPRNALGAEKTGSAHFAGGQAEGWNAPALNQQSSAPIAWNEASLYDYFRHGYSAYHGVATGPMGPVVADGLSQQPEDDLRALAHYMVSHLASSPAKNDQELARQLNQQSYGRMQPVASTGARLFSGACMACHHDGDNPKLFGVRPSLALNTSVHDNSPDNLLRIILDGIHEPARGDLGYMPGFRHSLNDQQIADLANYLREQFARKPAWQNLVDRSASLRQESAH